MLNAIAILYNRMGDNQQAVHIYTRCLEGTSANAGLRREVAVTLYNLGKCARRRSRNGSSRAWRTPNRATSTATSAIRAARHMPSVALLPWPTRRAIRAGRSTSSSRRRRSAQQTSDARLLAHIELVRGVSLHRLGRLADSEASLKSALDVFRQADALGDLSSTYAELALVQAEKGNWRDAYASQTQYKLISDQLLQQPAGSALRHAQSGVRHGGEGKGKRAADSRERGEREGAHAGAARAAATGGGDRSHGAARGVAGDVSRFISAARPCVCASWRSPMSSPACRIGATC